MSAYINKGNEAVTNRQKVNKLRAVENPEQWLVVTVTNTVNANTNIGTLSLRINGENAGLVSIDPFDLFLHF